MAGGGRRRSAGRYAVVAHLVPVSANRFPWGTLAVNMLGCFLVGVVYVATVEKGLLNAEWRLLLMTGFLGAFTTFSAFALEAVQLWQYGQLLNALIYVAASVVGCVAAAGLALFISSRLLG